MGKRLPILCVVQRSHIKAHPLSPTIVGPRRPVSSLQLRSPSLRDSPFASDLAAFASVCEARGIAEASKGSKGPKAKNPNVLNREKIFGIALGEEVMEVVNLGQF